MIGTRTHQYVSNDLSKRNFKNYWVVDEARVIQWEEGNVNVVLHAHGHKYRVVTTDQGIAVVRHIVPKRVDVVDTGTGKRGRTLPSLLTMSRKFVSIISRILGIK